MSIKKIIAFDFGGVICKERNPFSYLWGVKKISSEQKIQLLTLFKTKGYDSQRWLINDFELWTEIKNIVDSSMSIEDMIKYHTNQVLDDVDTKIIELIRIISPKHDLVLATNTRKYLLQGYKDKLYIDRYFKYILASCELQTRKPEFKYFQKLKEILESYDEHIYIDDRQTNIYTASELSINSKLFNLNNQTIQDLQEILIWFL